MLSVQTTEQLIASSRPRISFVRGPMFILLGLSILLGAMSVDSKIMPAYGALSWILPQLVFLAICGLCIRSAYRQREFARQMQDCFEAVQLQQWPRAWQSLSRLLRRPIPHPIARAESLLALASLADANDAFDASQLIYESMLEERQADPLQLHTARVGLGAALLRTGQTRDAVGLIDRLEREELPGVLRAHIEILALFREITMGHATERADRADERRMLFRRHLGTRAGYGYALLALVLDQNGDRRRAGSLWHDATMLVPPAELVRRFAQLQTVATRYPAAVFPPGLTSPTMPAAYNANTAEVSQ